MNKEEFQEKFWGGIFGIIAIAAAIGEAFANGISLSTILGAVKDISGTLVVVVLLVTFIKQLPRKLKNTSEILEQNVEKWGSDNAPLIFNISFLYLNFDLHGRNIGNKYPSDKEE